MNEKKKLALTQTANTEQLALVGAIAALEAKITRAETELQSLDKARRIAVCAKDGASLGFSLPEGVSDPESAYAWLVQCRQKVGAVHTTTPQQMTASIEIAEQILMPIDSQITTQKNELSKLKSELQTAQAENLTQNTPALVKSMRGQIKLLQASAKTHEQNATRLENDLKGIEVELSNLASQQKDADSKMADLIEAGQSVDDADLMMLLVKRQATEKRQDITRQALQKARASLKTDLSTIDNNRREIERLERLLELRTARKAVDSFVSELSKTVRKAVILDALKAAI